MTDSAESRNTDKLCDMNDGTIDLADLANIVDFWWDRQMPQPIGMAVSPRWMPILADSLLDHRVQDREKRPLVTISEIEFAGGAAILVEDASVPAGEIRFVQDGVVLARIYNIGAPA